MKWNGQDPIVIGEVDENNNVVEKVTINPGDEIPKKYLARMRKHGVITIGQDDPQDMKKVKQTFDFLDERKKGMH